MTDAAWLSRILRELLGPYRGQRLVGVVDCGDCTEVVFSGTPGHGANLLTLDQAGTYSHGFVLDPDRYVRDADAL